MLKNLRRKDNDAVFIERHQMHVLVIILGGKPIDLWLLSDSPQQRLWCHSMKTTCCLFFLRSLISLFQWLYPPPWLRPAKIKKKKREMRLEHILSFKKIQKLCFFLWWFFTQCDQTKGSESGGALTANCSLFLLSDFLPISCTARCTLHANTVHLHIRSTVQRSVLMYSSSRCTHTTTAQSAYGSYSW